MLSDESNIWEPAERQSIQRSHNSCRGRGTRGIVGTSSSVICAASDWAGHAPPNSGWAPAARQLSARRRQSKLSPARLCCHSMCTRWDVCLLGGAGDEAWHHGASIVSPSFSKTHIRLVLLRKNRQGIAEIWIRFGRFLWLFFGSFFNSLVVSLEQQFNSKYFKKSR